ncbi:MAG TPA: hypothetical protein VK395_22935 [Gemmataceae bacterium]|nr:hypothetical protein [Gemmataceae bacterium]
MTQAHQDDAVQPSFDHILDAGANLLIVAADCFRLLLDQQGDIRVLLEAVARSVEVQVKTLLLPG